MIYSFFAKNGIFYTFDWSCFLCVNLAPLVLNCYKSEEIICLFHFMCLKPRSFLFLVKVDMLDRRVKRVSANWKLSHFWIFYLDISTACDFVWAVSDTSRIGTSAVWVITVTRTDDCRAALLSRKSISPNLPSQQPRLLPKTKGYRQTHKHTHNQKINITYISNMLASCNAKSR